MVLNVIIIAFLALLALGMLGGVGISIIAFVAVCAWEVAKLTFIVVWGLFCLILSIPLRALAPETWKSVNRRELDERRRQKFFKSLAHENAALDHRQLVEQRRRRGEVYDLTPQLGSFSGPQLRPLEHRAKVPGGLAEPVEREPPA